MKNNLTENEYYDYMCSMEQFKTFEELHDIWYKCFSYILRSYKVGYTKKIIDSLFYGFEMANWKELHIEDSEYYKNKIKKELLDSFYGECHYISDRASYDRLFRTHWLFLNIFNDELNKVKYPELYEE